MTLKELLEEINDGDWLISNLYQMDFNSWRANLRKAGESEAHSKGYTAYSHGSTAFRALRGAWISAQDIDEQKKTEKKLAKKSKSTRYKMKD
jgi:hypothetical protein